MAMFHDRTAAPVCQRGLLRAAGPCAVLTSAEVVALTAGKPALPIPFAFRPAPPVDDPRSPEELLAEIAAEIDLQLGADQPELPPEPLLPAADAARTLHLRRQLAQAAEHGAALLASLGLPRLAGPDHIFVDPVAAGDALDLAIRTLDALDADPELEDDDREIPDDDELSLGWREAVAQLDLGQSSDDGGPTLGAPERCPWVPAMGASFYKPATGRRLQRCFVTRAWNQAEWAAGANVDGEGEPEVGYDLPEGDDEKCGSEHDGCEPEDHEPELGSPIGDGNQEHWAQGQDAETVNEDGEEGGGTFPPAARPFSPRRPDPMGHTMRDDARALTRRARDVRASLHPRTAAAKDPDTVTILRGGVALWNGPYVTRDGIPVVGCAT